MSPKRSHPHLSRPADAVGHLARRWSHSSYTSPSSSITKSSEGGSAKRESGSCYSPPRPHARKNHLNIFPRITYEQNKAFLNQTQSKQIKPNQDIPYVLI